MTDQEKRIEEASNKFIVGQGNNDIGLNAYPANLGFKAGAKWALETELASLRSELAEKEKDYNKLGVKFDKEMERLHERDHHNRMLIEAADKVIEAYRSQIYNGTDGKKHLKALEVYDQLKNTKP